LSSEYGALKREREHMKILIEIFAKKDLEIEEVSKKYRLLKVDKMRLEKQLRNAGEKHSSNQESLVEAKDNIVNLKNIIAKMENQFTESKKHLSVEHDKFSSLENRLIEINGDLDAKNKELSTYKILLLAAVVVLIIILIVS
ncbi:MAG: hypothetical protein AAF705_13505, partial [Bacteroidota bacterium]